MKQFSVMTIEFLVENRLRDSRDWFHEHKKQYQEHVLEPFQQLVSELSPAMLAMDEKLITEPKVDRTISRVYRDTRFTKDKSLYRDHMWCVFMRDKKLYHGPPAFYFELTPDWYRYGCGYYQASGNELQAMRDLILEDSTVFSAAHSAFEKQDIFVMEGESYKRSKYPDAPKELQTWLNRKGISISHTGTDFPLVFSEDLAAKISEDLRILKPVYNFFLAAHARTNRDR